MLEARQRSQQRAADLRMAREREAASEAPESVISVSIHTEGDEESVRSGPRVRQRLQVSMAEGEFVLCNGQYSQGR